MFSWATIQCIGFHGQQFNVLGISVFIEASIFVLILNWFSLCMVKRSPQRLLFSGISHFDFIYIDPCVLKYNMTSIFWFTYYLIPCLLVPSLMIFNHITFFAPYTTSIKYVNHKIFFCVPIFLALRMTSWISIDHRKWRVDFSWYKRKFSSYGSQRPLSQIYGISVHGKDYRPILPVKVYLIMDIHMNTFIVAQILKRNSN